MKKAIIVDIDGTIANIQHRLHYINKGKKDWDAFFAAAKDDTPIEHVCELVRRYATTHVILYVTGRPASILDTTGKWLMSNGLLEGNTQLGMRGIGDFRKDAVVKQEIFEKKIKGKYDVQFSLKDRDACVEMWRAQGIPCFQVAEES